MNEELCKVVYEHGDERIEVKYISGETCGYRVMMCKGGTCCLAFENREEANPSKERALALADILITRTLDIDDIPSMTFVKDGEEEVVGPALRVNFEGKEGLFYRTEIGRELP